MSINPTHLLWHVFEALERIEVDIERAVGGLPDDFDLKEMILNNVSGQKWTPDATNTIRESLQQAYDDWKKARGQ